jgi:hypothetical protein
MRKLFTAGIACLLLCFSAGSVQAQFANTNNILRKLFQPLLPPPSGAAPFLWDMAVHSTDDKYYTPVSYDSSNTDNWFALYFEMYHAAYDTNMSNLMKPKDVLDQAFAYEQAGNFVPIGLFDFEYNTFVDNAFDSTEFLKYFRWGGPDNDSIIDWVPQRDVDPHKWNPDNNSYLWQIFACAPLVRESYFADVDFLYTPQFSFYNSAYDRDILGYPSQTLQIDFGDGTGWHDITGSSYGFTAHYSAAGTYMIQMQLLDDGNNVIRHSESIFKVLTNHHKVIANGSLPSVEGITTGVYLGCGHDHIVKPLVYLKGIDPFESRHIPEIYDEMLARENLIMLKNYDYDIIIVEWASSTIDMRVNAASVINLLETIQAGLDADTNTNQIVLIGESMGGLIGRYALTMMETPDYINGTGVFGQPHPRSHNTRLFISLDAPQQGAFIPIEAQEGAAIAHITIPAGIGNVMFGAYDLIWKNNLHYSTVIQSEAAKQMLIYHINGLDIHGQFSALSEFTDFYNELKSLNPATGGYPAHCKKIALTNGLMDSSRQIGIGNRILLPGDKYMDMTLSMGYRILRSKHVGGLQLALTLKALPDGSGNIATGTMTLTGFSVTGCLKKLIFGSGGCWTTQTVTINEDVNDVKPYDVMPGGFYPSFIGAALDTNKVRNARHDWWVFSYDYKTSPGSVSYKSNLGFLSPGCFSFTLSADIENFEFIPRMSAIDYQAPSGMAMDHDLLHDPISTTMSRTPFDVVIGEYKAYYYPLVDTDWGQQFQHLNLRNDIVSGTRGGFLNREIGDEDLYLDNMNMNRLGKYEAKDNILVGMAENPYYKYPSPRPNVTPLTGMFAKQGGFVDDAGGDVEFKAGTEVRLQSGFEARAGSKLWVHIAPEHSCDLTWDQLYKKSPTAIEEDKKDTTMLKDGILVYPNPSSGSFNVKLNTIEHKFCKATLVNSTGQLVNSWNIAAGTDQFRIDQLPANGMYILIVQYKDKIYKEKLILNKN